MRVWTYSLLVAEGIWEESSFAKVYPGEKYVNLYDQFQMWSNRVKMFDVTVS